MIKNKNKNTQKGSLSAIHDSMQFLCMQREKSINMYDETHGHRYSHNEAKVNNWVHNAQIKHGKSTDHTKEVGRESLKYAKAKQGIRHAENHRK